MQSLSAMCSAWAPVVQHSTMGLQVFRSIGGPTIIAMALRTPGVLCTAAGGANVWLSGFEGALDRSVHGMPYPAGACSRAANSGVCAHHVFDCSVIGGGRLLIYTLSRYVLCLLLSACKATLHV